MRWTLSLAILVPVSMVAALVIYWATSNSNHSAVDVRYAIPLPAVCLAVAIASARRLPKMALCAIVLNLSAMAFIYSVDRFNILVQYEEWVDRGMPDSPFAK